jgi:hypothetical protein
MRFQAIACGEGDQRFREAARRKPRGRRMMTSQFPAFGQFSELRTTAVDQAQQALFWL